MKKKVFRSAVALVASGLALSVAACAGSEQSVQEACEIAIPQLAAVESNIAPESGEYDPNSKADRDKFMAPILEEMRAIPNSVDNTEVKSAFQDYSNLLQDTSDMMDKFDIENLELGSAEAEEKQAEFDEALEIKSKSMMDAIEHLNTLCDPA